MRRNVMLTIASLLSILFMTFHLTDDIVRGMEPGTLSQPHCGAHPGRLAAPLLIGGGWCSAVIVEIIVIFLSPVREQKHDFGIGLHRIMRSQPDIAGHGTLFNFEPGARFYLCKETFDPDRMSDVSLNLHPLERSLVDP